MTLYLDSSFLVAFLTNDVLSERAERCLEAAQPLLLVRDFAAAEFAAVITRRFRAGRITAENVQQSFSLFDCWVAQTAQHVITMSGDVRTAGVLIRRLDLTLRAPDAIHLAIAQRLGAAVATFDRQMVACARALGLDVITA